MQRLDCRALEHSKARELTRSYLVVLGELRRVGKGGAVKVYVHDVDGSDAMNHDTVITVAHVSMSDKSGGAARAAFRQHQALNRSGSVRSRMLVMSKLSSDPEVIAFDYRRSLLGRLERKLEKTRLDWVKRRAFRHRPLGLEVFSDDRSEQGKGAFDQLPDCDVVNLHWIDGFVPFEDVLKRFPRSGPVVWTLHDMAPFTGGCHYDHGCSGYVTGCGRCPQLGSTKEKDLAYAVWGRKQTAMRRWGSSRLTVVATSSWLRERAERSRLFRDIGFHTIPYGIDIGAFMPGNREESRKRFGLPINGLVLAFMATGAQLPRKGYELLREALEHLPCRHDLTLFTVGGGKPTSPAGLRHAHLDRAASDDEVVGVYRAADIFVMPSIQEAYGLTGQEAMACGIPLVGFRTGMCVDAVEHGRNGLLVDVGDVGGLRDAIEYLLDNPSERESMGAAARAHVCEQLSYECNARRYEELYLSLLTRQRDRDAGTRQ